MVSLWLGTGALWSEDTLYLLQEVCQFFVSQVLLGEGDEFSWEQRPLEADVQQYRVWEAPWA